MTEYILSLLSEEERDAIKAIITERDALRAQVLKFKAEEAEFDSEAASFKIIEMVKKLYSEVTQLRTEKDAAYHERDQMVAALSKRFPAAIGYHHEDPWEDDWRNIIYIWLPGNNQVSWHIHDSELPMFSHLQKQFVKWDGHTTEEKYERLSKIIPVYGTMAAEPADMELHYD